jgi:hypothetical protein
MGWLDHIGALWVLTGSALVVKLGGFLQGCRILAEIRRQRFARLKGLAEAPFAIDHGTLLVFLHLAIDILTALARLAPHHRHPCGGLRERKKEAIIFIITSKEQAASGIVSMRCMLRGRFAQRV